MFKGMALINSAPEPCIKYWGTIWNVTKFRTTFASTPVQRYLHLYHYRLTFWIPTDILSGCIMACSFVFCTNQGCIKCIISCTQKHFILNIKLIWRPRRLSGLFLSHRYAPEVSGSLSQASWRRRWRRWLGTTWTWRLPGGEHPSVEGESPGTQRQDERRAQDWERPTSGSNAGRSPCWHELHEDLSGYHAHGQQLEPTLKPFIWVTSFNTSSAARSHSIVEIIDIHT